ncbi:MAG: type II toxin-antitoxin system PemK/MazF family toxin [Acetobacteraceae bacterium]|nr:type II toxin-antitoxin system PemK/MazF family toxin [Acetobacteraceae bacterium]
MARIKAGTIVIVDWRGSALPNEPNKLRPAVVVEDDELFEPDYPNVVVVPLTSDAGLAIPGLSVILEPTPENGCERRCFALAPSVTTVSVRRVRATESRIQPEQLIELRRRIAETIGFS